jgi:ribosome-associated protein
MSHDPAGEPVPDPGEPAFEPGDGADPAADAAADRAEAPPTGKRPGLPARTTPPPEIDRASLDLARRIVELAEDKKAADIVLLEVAALTTIADYLVLCSGGSERQLDAIADGIVEGLKAEGIRILAREGEAASHWILLDVGSAIVHVFAPPERDYYALERLWAEARTVLRVQ